MGLRFFLLIMLPRLSANIQNTWSTSAQTSTTLAPAFAAGPFAAAATAAAVPGKDSHTVTANSPAAVAAAAPKPTGRRCRQVTKGRSWRPLRLVRAGAASPCCRVAPRAVVGSPLPLRYARSVFTRGVVFCRGGQSEQRWRWQEGRGGAGGVGSELDRAVACRNARCVGLEPHKT